MSEKEMKTLSLTDAQFDTMVEVLEERVDRFIKKRAKMLQEDKKRKNKRDELRLNFNTMYEAVVRRTSDNYGFEPSYEDTQYMLEELYVKSGVLKVDEKGFFDVKKRYPFSYYKLNC